MAESKSEPADAFEEATSLEDSVFQLEERIDRIFDTASDQAQRDDSLAAGALFEKVLDLIYWTLRPLGSDLPYDRIGLAVVGEDGTVSRSHRARAEADDVVTGAGIAAPLDGDSIASLLAAEEPLIINDLEAYLEEQPASEAARVLLDEGMRACIVCPLRAADKPLGLIAFASRDSQAYSDKQKEQLASVAHRFAVIVERGHMYERLNELSWQLRVARDALAYQVSHDSLTRLWNRATILEGAERERGRAYRQNKPITIVIVDIDDFKAINDTHGYGAGDDVLRGVAERLQRALRSYETVGRYGDEEFLVTLYDCNAEGAPHAMKRMLEAVAGSKIPTTKGDLEVTISLGAASSGDDEVELDELIRVANEAMSAAKESGRRGLVVRTAGESKE